MQDCYPGFIQGLLDRLQRGLEKAGFWGQAYEQEPLCVRGLLRQEELEQVASIGSVERALWYASRFAPQRIQLSNESNIVPTAEFSNKDPIRLVVEFMAKGYALAINYAELFDPHVAAMARGIGRLFNGTAYSSLFLNPPDCACFRPHFDGIDVLAIQVVGSKCWKLGEPQVLLASKNHVLAVEQEFLTPYEVTLEAGDLLYVPRGVAHAVSTVSSHSLHISFGIRPHRRVDVYREALALLALDEVELRRTQEGSLSPGYRRTQQDHEAGMTLRRKIFNPATLRDAVARANGRLYGELPVLPEDHLLEALSPYCIELETWVEKRVGMPIEVSVCGDGLAGIAFPGLSTALGEGEAPFVTAPLMVLPAFEFVRDRREPFRAIDLPGLLTEQSRVMLVTVLTQKGLLKRVKTEHSN